MRRTLLSILACLLLFAPSATALSMEDAAAAALPHATTRCTPTSSYAEVSFASSGSGSLSASGDAPGTFSSGSTSGGGTSSAWLEYQSNSGLTRTEAYASATSGGVTISSECFFPDLLLPITNDAAAGCTARPDDPVRLVAGELAVTEGGDLWFSGVSDGSPFLHALDGPLDSDATTTQAPGLHPTGVPFLLEYGPGGCSLRVGA